VPPAPEPDYKPQGDYTKLNGLKTYVTGPKDADKAILVLYDIFGFKNQILQGADLLAWSDKDSTYQVFMPDFFQESGPADIAWYPPDTDEKVRRYRRSALVVPS
jgi:dienelactone hydrolase